jgi:hypothetical protein
MNIPLAAILGMSVFLPWPHATIARSSLVMAVWQSTQSQASDPSPKDSSGPPSTDQKKTPDQSAAQPQGPAAATPTCPENSQPGSSTKSDCKPTPTAEAKTKTKKHPRPHKAVAPVEPTEGPPKTVVPNGGTDEPTVNLSPGPSPQASQQRERTQRLLATSNANLIKLSGRPLTANQQDTVKQVKSYMEQANTALSLEDVQRAYNLAVKANLLSAELAGH